MQVKDLIELLQEHDPEAEVHVANDRGYYEYLGGASCVDAEDYHDKAIEGEWPEPPICDGSCRKQGGGRPVVIWVD